jgi:hypothetical protein
MFVSCDHLSRGVLPSMLCLCVIVKPPQWGYPGTPRALAPWEGGREVEGVAILLTHSMEQSPS